MPFRDLILGSSGTENQVPLVWILNKISIKSKTERADVKHTGCGYFDPDLADN